MSRDYGRGPVDEDIKFSILVPTYNGEGYVIEMLQSILSQSYKNFEIIVNDDCSTDRTVEVIEALGDERIKVFRNAVNLGYPGNMDVCTKHAEGEVFYLMAQDDILSDDALLKTYNAFKMSPDVGAVTRPFFQFLDNLGNLEPIRIKLQLNPDQDEIVTIDDDPQRVIRVFQSVDQLSGLAIRRDCIERPFHEDVFPCHVYPFASVLRNYSIVFLKDYVLAQRMSSSQCRHVKSIYEKSPMRSWVEMFENVFPESRYDTVRKACIRDFVAVNYVGLVQLKNFSTYKNLLREIWYLVKYRPANLVNPVFWFFSLGTIVVPACILLPMADAYKRKINSKLIKKIDFSYTLHPCEGPVCRSGMSHGAHK